MTLPDQMIRDGLLNSRRRRINAVYARFYGALCLLILTLTFFPYYETAPSSPVSYGNLWQEVLVVGRGVELAVLVLLLLTLALLILATTGRVSITGLIAVLAASVVIGCTLWQSPGYVRPPSLTDFGAADIVLSFVTAAMALAHTLHLFVLELAFQRRGD